MHLVAVDSDAGTESLSCVLDRLGQPPSDILDGWCKQLCYAAIVHHEDTGKPLPPIDSDRWQVNPTGELACNGFAFRVSPTADWPQPDPESLQHIIQFRDQFDPAPQAAVMDVSVRGSKAEPAENDDSQLPRKQRRRSVKPASSLRRHLFAAAMAACVAAIGAVLYQATRKPPKPIADSDPSVAAPNVFDPGNGSDAALDPVGSSHASVSLNTDPVGNDDPLNEVAVPGDADMDLQMIESVQGDSVHGDMAESGSATKQPADLSLDSLLPAMNAASDSASDSANQQNADAIVTDSDASPDSVGEMPDLVESLGQGKIGDGQGIDPLADDDSTGPDESPQPTRAAEISAKSLPEIDDAQSLVTLIAAQAETLRLEFPHKVDLELSPAEADSRQTIRSTRSQAPVASVFSQDDGVQFQWVDAAAKQPLSRFLLHGRVKDAAGNVTYLRPTILADPMSIRLDESDIHPSWDLTGPIPPGAQLSISFSLPKEVEQAWIQPIDPSSIRRTRGLAVLTPKDGETVSLGLRFDIRCSRKLSTRIRYAARLDNSMPWQLVSRPMLEQLANQITNQQTFISNRLIQLDKLRSAVDYAGRREVKKQREFVEGQAKQLKLIAGRVSDLQELILAVEAEGDLILKVSVPWSDTEQVLLETVAKEDDE